MGLHISRGIQNFIIFLIFLIHFTKLQRMAAEILERTVESKFLPLELFQCLMNFLANTSQSKNIKQCPPSHTFKLKYSNVYQRIDCYNEKSFIFYLLSSSFSLYLCYSIEIPGQKPTFEKSYSSF